MANITTLPGDLNVSNGQIRHKNDFSPPIARAQLAQRTLAKFVIPLTAWRIWDSLITTLPAAGSNDDLGLVQGTFGTGSPSLQTGDVKALGAVTRYARALIPIPPDYEAGQTLQLRCHAGMLTNDADNSATLDVQAYKSDGEAGIGSDLVTTAATSINDVAYADVDFTIDGTGLSPGDWLDVRIAIATNDAATGSAVIGCIGEVALLADLR